MKNSLQRSLLSLINSENSFSDYCFCIEMTFAWHGSCRGCKVQVAGWRCTSLFYHKWNNPNLGKNVNLRPKYYFLVLVLALVKAWGLSALVKQWPATLTCNLQFTPSVAPEWLGNLKEASPLSERYQCSYYFFYHFCCISHFMSKAQELLFHKILVVKKS